MLVNICQRPIRKVLSGLSLDDITILGSDTDKSTYTTVKFQRKLNTGDTQDLKLSVGQPIFICYAFRQGSLTL